jgi:hypothetical protein
LLFATCLPAQQPGNDSTVNTANAIRVYQQFLYPEKDLYNGRQYIAYASTLYKGHPYFQSPERIEGNIFYDGVLYEQVPMQHDIVKNLVLIEEPYKKFTIELQNEKIGWFTIGNTRFTHIKAIPGKTGIPEGFYQTIYDGNTILLKKDSKVITEKLELKVVLSIQEIQDYFIKKNGSYYPVDDRSSILKVLKDKKNELTQYIRKSNIDFKTNFEESLISTLVYYDTLIR